MPPQLFGDFKTRVFAVGSISRVYLIRFFSSIRVVVAVYATPELYLSLFFFFVDCCLKRFLYMTRFDVHIIEFYARIFINQAQYRITHTLMGCGFFFVGYWSIFIGRYACYQ